ncbi:MAG: hypothetical protein QMC81_00730 [Thermoanaerobacterales bacterium]|nr:hypothetical protein [Thermoanaerobacterales bacterium]
MLRVKGGRGVVRLVSLTGRRGLALLCLVLALWPGPGLADPAGVPGADQRGRDAALMSAYTAREKSLASELLALDLQLDDMRDEQRRLQDRLEALERDAAAAQEELAAAGERLAASRARLGRWLRYLYENGRLTLLGILLDASSFGDLLRRLELVRWLAVYEADLFRDVQARRDAVTANLARARTLEREIGRKETALAARIAETEELHRTKTEMLSALRAESADLARRITALEEQWYASLTPLHSLLGQLDRLFIKELRPDRVYFAGRNVRLEVSEATINAALGRMDIGERSALRIRVAPEGITIAGVSDGTTSFSLTGSLVPDRDGRSVRFMPESLTLDGTPVQPEVLRKIASEGGLFFALDRHFSLFAVHSITTADDKVTIALGPR